MTCTFIFFYGSLLQYWQIDYRSKGTTGDVTGFNYAMAGKLVIWKITNDISVMAFNYMGSWHINLSDYMGGRCLWKFNSMGVGVKKVSYPTPFKIGLIFILASRIFVTSFFCL